MLPVPLEENRDLRYVNFVWMDWANRFTGQLDREGNARKVVNCSCVVVKDWGEESQERSVLLNYFQTEQ